MAEFGLFVGWGSPHPGKEAASIGVFREATAYWEGLQAAGEIESFEPVILGFHGGDLIGFALLRGDPEKLVRISMSPEFQRLTQRAAACMESVGVVHAVIGTGVAGQLGRWGEAIRDLR
jgi:hypothetical protein